MKPLNLIEKVFEKASDTARVKVLNPRSTLQFRLSGKPVCILIHSGTAYLCRREDRMIIALCEGPLIAGLRNIYTNKEDIEDVYLLAHSAVIYEIVPAENMRHIVEQHNLWREVSELMMYTAGALLQNFRLYAGKKSSELINNALFSLMQQPQEFRATQNTTEYIQDRTMLSRSLIMGALGTLKRMGYIKMKKGILESIEDTLPPSY